jgi:hypothetical protein
MKKSLKKSFGLAVVLFLLVPGLALAECTLSGHIEAEMTEDADLPAYLYTMTIDWDMGSPYGLSHLDLVVDMQGGTCDCSDFAEAISFGMYGGESTGEEDCMVNYLVELECSGDPSIPGVDGILFKFEPIESEGCEPGPVGTGTFVFYSDLAPVPVDEESVALIDKAGGEFCTGGVTGVFPGLACDPVSSKTSSMDGLKSLYR